MSVPQRQAGGEKLWDDLDAETFGDHDGSAALSNWAEQAKAFEAEMQAMRKAGGGKLPGEPVGNKDMFGAAFSEAPDVAPALTGQEDAEELAQRARARGAPSSGGGGSQARAAAAAPTTGGRRPLARAAVVLPRPAGRGAGPLRGHADAPVVPGGLLR